VSEQQNYCFGCGDENPIGLHLQFELSGTDAEKPIVTAAVILDRRYAGGTGFLHGGILATLMDEAMSKLNKPLGVKALTRQLEVDYLRPSPIDVPLKLIGLHLRREDRKLFHAAELRDESGALLAKSTTISDT
jgi:uncharacterized protein (TIGR00369 family)